MSSRPESSKSESNHGDVKDFFRKNARRKGKKDKKKKNDKVVLRYQRHDKPFDKDKIPVHWPSDANGIHFPTFEFPLMDFGTPNGSDDEFCGVQEGPNGE